MSTPNLTIRVLGPGEAPVLDRVAPDVFDFPIDVHWTTEFFADARHHLVVALLDGEVIGMATGLYYVYLDKPPELWVNEVGVAPPYQNQGIGRQLLRALFAHAQTLGCVAAWVGTEPDNWPARRLYTAVGGNEEPMVTYSFQLATGQESTDA